MPHPETSEPYISIIILNFNGGNTVLECIRSVFKTTNCKFEVILVDNNSSDNSQELCKKEFPEIILIQNKENTGMTARNQGIKNAKGNFVVFLDSDTIVEPNWLSKFLESFKEHGEGLYQPKLLEKQRPTIINSAGNMLNIFGLAYSRGKEEEDSGQYDSFQRVSYTSGACTFTSLEIINKIGEIDPIFFAYHDDVDYGWRAALQDVPSYYEPKITVYHYGSPILKWSPTKFFLLERNRWVCLLTLYSRSTLLKIFPLLILVEFGVLLFFISKGMGLMKLKSFFSIMRLCRKLEQRHKKLEKDRKVSDVDIIKSFVDHFYITPISSGEISTSRVNSIISSLDKRARKIINA
jgi:GT2 family glycosyltransferase